MIFVVFDNVHFTRDNPNVPSDLEQMPRGDHTNRCVGIGNEDRYNRNLRNLATVWTTRCRGSIMLRR